MQKNISCWCLCWAALTVQASEFSLALSDNTLSFDYVGATQNGTLEFNLGGLHHSENGDMASLGFHVAQRTHPNAQGLVGLKAVGLLIDDQNSAAMALGGSFKAALPLIDQLYWGAHAWYAPSVVSFNRIKNFRDAGAQLSYRLLNNAALFVAYREVQVRDDNGWDREVFKGTQTGIELTF